VSRSQMSPAAFDPTELPDGVAIGFEATLPPVIVAFSPVTDASCAAAFDGDIGNSCKYPL
jgi:hypothetical protein